MKTILTIYLASFVLGALVFAIDYIKYRKHYYRSMIKGNGAYFLRKSLK